MKEKKQRNQEQEIVDSIGGLGGPAPKLCPGPRSWLSRPRASALRWDQDRVWQQQFDIDLP